MWHLILLKDCGHRCTLHGLLKAFSIYKCYQRVRVGLWDLVPFQNCGFFFFFLDICEEFQKKPKPRWKCPCSKHISHIITVLWSQLFFMCGGLKDGPTCKDQRILLGHLTVDQLNGNFHFVCFVYWEAFCGCFKGKRLRNMTLKMSVTSPKALDLSPQCFAEVCETFW